MKLLALVILLFSVSTFAQSKADLSAKFTAYVQQKTESLEGDVEKDFRDLALVKLSETDSSLIQNALLTLVKLDKEDPSRTSVQVLGPSYSKNTKLFQKAFQIIRTSENAAVLKEIEQIMKSFDSGNG
jgi:hypothetical protein